MNRKNDEPVKSAWAWELGKPIDGVVEAEPKSYRGLVDLIEYLGVNNPRYIWRGQRKSTWDLTARLYRDPKFRGTDGEVLMQRHLDGFKRAARGRRGPNPPVLATDNDWWALGQAHGLATPLLDWTGSPFAAAYFAFHEVAEHDQTTHRTIFALDRGAVKHEWLRRNDAIMLHELQEKTTPSGDDKREPLLERLRKVPKPVSTKELYRLQLEESSVAAEEEKKRRERRRTENPYMDFVDPLGDENARLVNQNGVFTRTQSGEDVETFVKKMFKGSPDRILVKINLINGQRQILLRSLNQMNINHATLFPDLHGATTFCNMRWEIPDYEDVYDFPIPDFFVDQ